ncbi:hypothetical protein [Winogradskyella sediminis]|uniref:hypothetical protein n=1 Tax=Winogradskyella sediminis TaxID=1382466 RepID=UPI000E2282AC|nr:hypothetical protein [Winogradskyella sediminis]REG82112.1 hypothetical protein C8N41_1231 [Winogradskyella sediminis]
MYDREKVENFQIRMEEIIEKHNTKDAFELITSELNECEDKYLTEFMAPLNFLKYEPVLDWVEQNADRVKNVTQDWGHLSASSNFSWKRAEKWLEIGRPLSLIALDAIMFCTTRGERLNQSLWMRELNPKLTDNPKLDRIANGLKQYIEKDSVPRTKNAVSRIINDIFEIG